MFGRLAAADAVGPWGQPLLGTAVLLLLRGPGEGRKQSATGAARRGRAPPGTRSFPIPSGSTSVPTALSPDCMVLGRNLLGIRWMLVRVGAGLAAHRVGQQQAGEQQDSECPKPLHAAAAPCETPE